MVDENHSAQMLLKLPFKFRDSCGVFVEEERTVYFRSGENMEIFEPIIVFAICITQSRYGFAFCYTDFVKLCNTLIRSELVVPNAARVNVVEIVSE